MPDNKGETAVIGVLRKGISSSSKIQNGKKKAAWKGKKSLEGK